MGSDFRWFLRDRTGAAHNRLDASIGQFVDPNTYASYVRSLYRFRAPVEEALSRRKLPESFGAYRPAMLTGEIVQDLGDLKTSLPPLLPSRLDMGGAGLFGVLYVLEGAALGARVLIKRASALGFDGGFGARHLAVAAGGTSWPAFLALLDSSEVPDPEQAADAALATFDLALEAFESVPA